MAMWSAVAARPAAANVWLHNENLVLAEHWQGRKFTVVSQPAQAIEADGEVLPAGSVSVQVLPGDKAE